MSNDVLGVFQALFTTVWSIFTSVTIPGTRVSLASFLLLLVVAPMSIRFIVRLLGVAADSKGGGKTD